MLRDVEEFLTHTSASEFLCFLKYMYLKRFREAGVGDALRAKSPRKRALSRNNRHIATRFVLLCHYK